MKLKFDWELPKQDSRLTMRQAVLYHDTGIFMVSQIKILMSNNFDDIVWDKPYVVYHDIIMPSSPKEIEIWVDILIDINTILCDWMADVFTHEIKRSK